MGARVSETVDGSEVGKAAARDHARDFGSGMTDRNLSGPAVLSYFAALRNSIRAHRYQELKAFILAACNRMPLITANPYRPVHATQISRERYVVKCHHSVG